MCGQAQRPRRSAAGVGVGRAAWSRKQNGAESATSGNLGGVSLPSMASVDAGGDGGAAAKAYANWTYWLWRPR